MNTLAGAVGLTLGPSGRTVVTDKRWDGPSVISDGFAISRELQLPDPLQDLAVQLVNQAAEHAYETCGDGTTSTIVLAATMINAAHKNIAAGADPMALRRGLQEAAGALIRALRARARPLESEDQVESVATLAAKDPVIGRLVAQALEKSGDQGIILVEESSGTGIELECVRGMRFDGGYLSAEFVTDRERMEVELEDPYVMITEEELRSVDDILPALERVLHLTRTLLIVCGGAEGEALAGLVMNKQRGNLEVVAVKAPGYGDRRSENLVDIATFLGGQVLPDEHAGRTLRAIRPEDLGRADKVVASMDQTTILGGRGDRETIQHRSREIQRQMDEAQTAQYRRRQVRRQGSLAGRMAILHVGGFTESEITEKKTRVENAVAAVKAAQEGGILPGGGVGLIDSLSALDDLKLTEDEAAGARILYEAVQAPALLIAQNAGQRPTEVLYKIHQSPEGHGFDATSGTFGDLYAMGIIDPQIVVERALISAVSVAASLMTVETLIVHPSADENRLDLSAKYE
jgi:chaperonin GroEL